MGIISSDISALPYGLNELLLVSNKYCAWPVATTQYVLLLSLLPLVMMMILVYVSVLWYFNFRAEKSIILRRLVYAH